MAARHSDRAARAECPAGLAGAGVPVVDRRRDRVPRRPGMTAMTRLTQAGAVINAERIKLTTIRSPLWSTVAAAVLSLGIAALQAASAYEYNPLTAPDAALGVAVFGVPVLMVVAAMTVTGEYRTAMIRTTFTATPDRTLVIGAKAVVAAVFSGCRRGDSWWSARCSWEGSGSGPTVGAPRPRWRSTRRWPPCSVSVSPRCCGTPRARSPCCCCGRCSSNRCWPTCRAAVAQIGPYLPFANMFRFLEVRVAVPGLCAPVGRARVTRLLRRCRRRGVRRSRRRGEPSGRLT